MNKWIRATYHKPKVDWIYLIREHDTGSAEVFFIGVRDPLLLDKDEYRKLKYNLV